MRLCEYDEGGGGGRTTRVSVCAFVRVSVCTSARVSVRVSESECMEGKLVKQLLLPLRRWDRRMGGLGQSGLRSAGVQE